jgi:MFS family permease
MVRAIPLLIAASAGAVLILAVFFKELQPLEGRVQEWFTILAAVAFLVGGANLLMHHLQVISDRKRGWGYSAVTLSAFVITLVAGLLKIGGMPSNSSPDHPWSGGYQDEGSVFWWLYLYVMAPITSTMFSLLAFYVASAAYRAFRARSLESLLLLSTALIVLLGRTYAGTVLTASFPEPFTFPGATVLIMGVFTTAGQRAIMIGIALGVAATSIRILIGMDRSYLGADGE